MHGLSANEEIDYWRGRARAAEAKLAAYEAVVRSIADAIEHDIMLGTNHRRARQTGGQHCGTGGPLGGMNPSGLVYLDRVVRDLRSALDKREKGAL